jgi:uracil-DNA glycosylase
MTNVVKYMPIGGKIPSPKEIKSHAMFLKEEIKMINPQVVVTLGNIALNGVGLRQPLDNVHGRTFNFGSYELVPTFHPKHASGDPQIKLMMETDLAKLKELLKKPVSTD